MKPSNTYGVGETCPSLQFSPTVTSVQMKTGLSDRQKQHAEIRPQKAAFRGRGVGLSTHSQTSRSQKNHSLHPRGWGPLLVPVDKETSSKCPLSRPPDGRPWSLCLITNCCQLERYPGRSWRSSCFVPWPLEGKRTLTPSSCALAAE